MDTKPVLRADDSSWLRSPLLDAVADMVCCIRKASKSEFAREVPKQRVYTMPGIQRDLFN